MKFGILAQAWITIEKLNEVHELILKEEGKEN